MKRLKQLWQSIRKKRGHQESGLYPFADVFAQLIVEIRANPELMAAMQSILGTPITEEEPDEGLLIKYLTAVATSILTFAAMYNQTQQQSQSATPRGINEGGQDND